MGIFDVDRARFQDGSGFYAGPFLYDGNRLTYSGWGSTKYGQGGSEYDEPYLGHKVAALGKYYVKVHEW